MNLREIFQAHDGALVHKWNHYFEIYERYFSKYRNREITMLEIGISHGGSLALWKKYFGDGLRLYAIDVNPECKKLESENVTIFIGSQSDPTFLQTVIDQCPPFDIILDDGGHTMQQQIISFEKLFPQVKNDGIYICEDTLTSYLYEYHGGYKKKNSFIEFSKNLIDKLHAWHIPAPKKIKVDDYTKTIQSIHFYDCMVVIEKTIPKEAPYTLQKGKKTIADYREPELRKHHLFSKIILKLKTIFK
ncbi:MAG: class I SAM-dependent methyltransferase [Chitinophagaceae bacterium]|nr:class I SAM-dependent methyltransferase [Chitinophagaceae bacterium]